MSVLLPVRPVHFEAGRIFALHLSTSNPSSSFCSRASRRNLVSGRTRWTSRVRSSANPEDPTETTSNEVEIEDLLSIRPWNVPWDWKITASVMTPYIMSILLSGALKSSRSGYPTMEGGEEAAILFFGDQLLKTMVKLSVIYFFVSRHQPLPDDVFSFKWNQPFDLQRGWLLWAASGLLVASGVAFLTTAILTGSLGSQVQNERESLAWLTPFIGSSNISTLSIMGVLGVLAPVSEEILYRGFLLTSLTKWLPPSSSIILSSAVFTLAHLSPGKSPEIFIFGIVLGIVYAQTRNLLTPICMHAFWNLGVVLTLTLLQANTILNTIPNHTCHHAVMIGGDDALEEGANEGGRMLRI